MNIHLDFFLTFSKIGLFTIGGGYAMIPLVEREVVNNKKWVEKEEFLDILAIAQSAPGVLAVNMAVFIGYKLKGIKGCIVTALGTILPSFLIILLIAACFVNFKDNPVVESVFKGIRPTIAALLVVPVFNTAKNAGITRKTIFIPIVAALLIWILGISPVFIVSAAVLCGIIFGKMKTIRNN